MVLTSMQRPWPLTGNVWTTRGLGGRGRGLLRSTRWEGAGAEEESGAQASAEERQEAPEVMKLGMMSQASH